jgi:hypothetical protein
MVATLVAWEFGPDLSRRQRRLMLLMAAFLTLAGLFAYLYLYSSFVVTVAGDSRLIVGYECNAPTQAVYPKKCPELGEIELERAGYDPAALFTKTALTNVRLMLVASWSVFMAGLLAAVGWVVAGRTTPLTEA